MDRSGEENNNIWFINYTDYADSLFETLLEIEEKRKSLDYDIDQMHMRKSLIYLLFQIKQSYQLQNASLYLAVYIIDYTLNHVVIEEAEMELFAVTALLLAIKVEERNATNFSQLNRFFLDEKYSLDDYERMEVKLLILTKFDLVQATVANFIDALSKFVLELGEYERNRQTDVEAIVKYEARYESSGLRRIMYVQLQRETGNYEKACAHMTACMHKLATHSILLPEFYNLKGSLLAAACLVKTREMYRFHTVWPHRVEQRAKYSLQEIKPIVNIIDTCIEKMFIEYIHCEIPVSKDICHFQVRAFADEFRQVAPIRKLKSKQNKEIDIIYKVILEDIPNNSVGASGDNKIKKPDNTNGCAEKAMDCEAIIIGREANIINVHRDTESNSYQDNYSDICTKDEPVNHDSMESNKDIEGNSGNSKTVVDNTLSFGPINTNDKEQHSLGNANK